jgi:hypothetical protein
LIAQFDKHPPAPLALIPVIFMLWLTHDPIRA